MENVRNYKFNTLTRDISTFSNCVGIITKIKEKLEDETEET